MVDSAASARFPAGQPLRHCNGESSVIGSRRPTGHLHRPRWRGLVPTRSVHRLRRHASAGKIGQGGRERQTHDDSSTVISPDLDDDAHGGQPARTPHPRLSEGESRQWNARADHQRRTAKPCGVEHGDVCRKAVRHARILGDLSRRGRRRLDRVRPPLHVLVLRSVSTSRGCKSIVAGSVGARQARPGRT